MLIFWLHTSSTRIREAQTSEFALGCRRDVPPPLLVGVHPNPGPRTTGFLAESERWNIIFLSKEKGLSIREISKRLHVAPNTVASTLSRFRETNTVHDRARSGRKRKLSREEEEKMIRKAKKGLKSPQITREYKRETGKTISDRTVRRTLKVQHLAYKKATKIRLCGQWRYCLNSPETACTTIRLIHRI